MAAVLRAVANARLALTSDEFLEEVPPVRVHVYLQSRITTEWQNGTEGSSNVGATAPGHGGPRHSAWAERIVEGNEPDQQARAAFAEDPLHGLYCRRRWMRATFRHDGIREDIPGVQASRG